MTAVRAGLTTVAVWIAAAIVLGIALFALVRLWPRPDPLPAQIARADEKAAACAATAIGERTSAANSDAQLHIDLTTRTIRDAFDQPVAPAPASIAGDGARPLPAAPVDGVRDQLNAGIARANRAAGSAAPPE